jgi:hypothetical protein
MAHSWLQTFAKRANFHQRFSATASCSIWPFPPLSQISISQPYCHPLFALSILYGYSCLRCRAPCCLCSKPLRIGPTSAISVPGFFFSPWYYVLFDWCNATTIQVGFQALPGCWAVVTQLGCHKNVHCITHQSSDACNSSQTVTASHKDFPELHPNNPYSFENALLAVTKPD